MRGPAERTPGGSHASSTHHARPAPTVSSGDSLRGSVTHDAVDIDDAIEWVRSLVGPGASMHPMHAEPWATVFRIDGSDDVFWFKVCAPTHAFEVPLTASLSSRWRETVT